MNLFNYIIWTLDPDIFTLPIINNPVRWYGLLFASGFIIGQQIFFWFFKEENRPKKDIDTLTGYMVLATIIGARLGHCLFYNPKYYLGNPIEILKVWEGGLASHGGAIGIIIAIYFFCKKHKYHMFWVLDRMVIVVALTAALIRLGNLCNSEMEGTLTGSKMGIIYARHTKDVLNYDKEKIDKVWFEKGGKMTSDNPSIVPITAHIKYKKGVNPQNERIFIERQVATGVNSYTEVVEHVDFGGNRLDYEIDNQTIKIQALGMVRHAAQVYEATYCLILMALLFWFWWKKRDVLPRGFNFAFFMIMLWSLRFVDEFFKMSQESFEDDMVLNMGQILSIPLTLVGIVTMVLIYRKDKKMSDFQ